MNEPINIPLNIDPTRQVIWRVVRVVLTALMITLIGWTIARGATTFDRTLSLVPTDADVVLRILKTRDSTSLAEHELSGMALLPGAPWSLKEGLSMSSRGINYIAKNDEHAVIIDRALSNDMAATAKAYGFHVHITHGMTVIASDEDLISTEKTLPHLSFALLFSQNDALIVDPHGNTAPVNSEAGEIMISGASLFSASRDESHYRSGDHVLATLSISQSLTDVFGAFSPSENTPGAQLLSSLITSEDTSITVFEDTAGIGYTFLMPLSAAMTISNDQLVEIGKEIIGIPELTQNELTLPDGTVVNELRTSLSDVTIVDEHPYSFVTVEKNGKRVTISRTTNLLRITNRPIEPNEERIDARSSCLHRAKAWIRPEELLSTLPSSTVHRAVTLSSLLRTVDEVASKKNATRICW